MELSEISFYKKLVSEHRGTSMQIGCSENGQKKRFDAILCMLNSMLGEKVKDLSILDFGCGKGDLRPLLKVKKYIGIDAIEENIHDAKINFPDSDFRLLNWDGNSELLNSGELVDVILFSGCFATTYWETRDRMFKKLLDIAHIGIIGNFLTFNKLIENYSGCVLTYPNDILLLIDTSKYGVQIKMDYLPHDFTIGACKWENQ